MIKSISSNVIKFSFLALFISLLTACGGGGGGSTSVVDETSGTNSVRSASKVISPGATCEFGGVEIEAGIDTNSNGVLDSDEVDETLVICNGAEGYNSLIRLTDEPTGNNCVSGGVKIDSGMDVNRNDVLDGGEVASTKYVCDGTNGTNGTNGTDNSAIASIFCSGGLQNFTGVQWSYSVHQLNSGDVIATGQIYDSLISTSKTNYYSVIQNGYSDAGVTMSYDLLGSFNYGWWDISLNRNTLVVTINYHDSDLVTNPTYWVMDSSLCIVNYY